MISKICGDIEHTLHAIQQRIPDRQDIDSNASFFALGGTLLDTIRAKGDIKRQLGLEIDVTDLFKYPTFTALTYLPNTAVPPEDAILTCAVIYSDMPVAIVGMAGRLPDAANIAALWTSVVGGESGLTLFSDEELRVHGVTPNTLKQADYIKTKRIIDNHKWFDAGFFGYIPNKVECMDPQIRLLHQCRRQTPEHAGCDPATSTGVINIYAGLLTSPH